ARQEQTTARPNAGSSGSKSGITNPRPPQWGHSSPPLPLSSGGCGGTLPFDNVLVLFRNVSSCIRLSISAVVSIMLPFLSPPLQDGEHVAPLAHVVLDRFLNRLLNPASGVSLFGVAQLVRNERRKGANVLFVKHKDIRPFHQQRQRRLIGGAGLPLATGDSIHGRASFLGIQKVEVGHTIHALHVDVQERP